MLLPGRGHGIAIIASVAGGLAGWVLALAVPGSNPVFQDDAPSLSADPETDLVQYPTASAPSYAVSSQSAHASRLRASRGFDLVMESLAQSHQALRAGDTASAGAHLYDALEAALQPGSTDPMARENAPHRAYDHASHGAPAPLEPSILGLRAWTPSAKSSGPLSAFTRLAAVDHSHGD